MAASALAVADNPKRTGRPVAVPKQKTVVTFLFVANGIFQAAHGVLDFALHLIGLSFTFGLCIAAGFARPFFDFAFGLLGRTLDAILVNHCIAPECDHQENVSAGAMFRAVPPDERRQGASQILHRPIANSPGGLFCDNLLRRVKLPGNDAEFRARAFDGKLASNPATQFRGLE
jgi:hypothetical protein